MNFVDIDDAEAIRHYVAASVVEGGQGLFLATLVRDAEKGVVHIARNDVAMASVVEALEFFAPEVEVLPLPAWDCLPYDRVSPNSVISNQRIETLSRLAGGGGASPYVVVTTINAVLQRVPPRTLLTEAAFLVRQQQQVVRDKLADFLVSNGYVNSGTAAEPGEFALRGSIVDIVPMGVGCGFRLDFFGDVVESIRVFDPLTQISQGRVEEILLRPASEALADEDAATRFTRQYKEQFGEPGDDPLYEAVAEGRHYAGMEHWLSLFHDALDTVFSYTPDAVVTLDHLVDEARAERLETIRDHYEARQASRAASFSMGAVYKPLPPEQLYVLEEEWEEYIGRRAVVALSPFAAPPGEGVIAVEQKVAPNMVAEAKTQQKSVFELVRALVVAESRPVVIACFSEGSRERLRTMLESNDVAAKGLEAWEEVASLAKHVVGLVVLGLEHGVETEGCVLLSEQDLFGERVGRARRPRAASEKFLQEASGLEEGELVVHKEHGLGRFERLEVVEVSGEKHDCLRLIYDGGDRLFVPVENIDVITRYGSREEAAQLDKLGGVAWQRRKAVLKQHIKMAAEELLRVAAERALKKAASLAVHGGYDEFCTRFPYAETEDQLRVIDEVVVDLTSGRPMDRLVCGDVGFGKTEVALRAAFVACQPGEENGGQVAVIAPTTQSCQQHYHTFKKRFDGFPVKIRQLSRLVSTGEAATVRKEIASGEADIVIGTHALLSKQVNFKKLSLLVVDEEHRFGVKQKEALKRLRADTHVLALTATPIPRTLQMSLAGVRDLSLITTPPVDRLAVRTYVMPFDPVVIREALLREHYRGGQSFYICPRIQDLAEVEKKIRQLVPEVKLVVAHGQMAADELDEKVQGFYQRKYDVLLSTTIIESGLDIPTANTMVVHRADRFGLAQLYQLRGRVGRSKTRAYAYLTLPQGQMLTKQAVQRLEVMQRLDTLGAGFTLASYDMDIRGFGNMLGEEQSGHIKEVGVELYQQMLEEAIAAVKAEEAGEEVRESEWSPQINIGMAVLLPEEYVEDLPLRLSLYRRIAHLKTEEEIEAMAAELIDRFGPLPEAVEHLLTVVKLKQLCRRAHIGKVEAGPKGAVVVFHEGYFPAPEKLLAYVAGAAETHKLRPDQSMHVVGQAWQQPEARLKGVRQMLQDVAGLVGD